METALEHSLYFLSTNQVISLVGLDNCPAANEWSSIQNNNNNEYYLSLADGSYNNNNKYNQYWVVPVASEKLCKQVFKAERDCWKNKHSSYDAAKYHYHLSDDIWKLIDELFNNTYYPDRGYSFIVIKPKPREIFAAHYRDRIIHHLVAPYMMAVSEAVHTFNKNMSYGNRKGRSAYHACVRLQKYMSEIPTGYVASWDMKNYFMSINREISWNVFRQYEERFKPVGYTEEERQFLMSIIKILLLNNPSTNCDLISPRHLKDTYITPDKTITDITGQPVGNFYSQIIANLLLAIVCEAISGYNVVEFVDDFAGVFETIEDINECERLIDEACSKIHVTRSPNKKYIQRVDKGILWCGNKIYKNRIYTNSRTIHLCSRKIDDFLKQEKNLDNTIKLISTVNSYFGMFSRNSEFNTQLRLVKKIIETDYSKYIQIKRKPNHIILRLKDEYKSSNISKQTYVELNRFYHDSCTCKEK